MPVSRRRALALMGGGTVLAAGAGAGAFLATRTPHAALAPWVRAGSYGDARLDALSWALLAPNPHNRQPWEAELVGDDVLRLYRDPARNLPQTDPHGRQLTTGMGCFIELMVIAASASGHGVDLTLFPDGQADGRPVAEARFMPGAASPDPLFAHVPARGTIREAYAAHLPDRAAVQSLSAHARVITDADDVADLRQLTWDGWLTEALTPAAHGETVDLMRIGRREIEANPDGLALGGPFYESLALAGLLTRRAQRDPQSRGFQFGISTFERILAATPAYAVIVTQGNDAHTHIDVGRRWMRFDLTATGLGLATHPLLQVTQEYAEMATLRVQAQTLLAGEGETVQFIARLGHGPTRRARSPRWSLETRIRHG
ncbi:MAG: twin-arginine translocation pathway signal protein [Pararhodobacter sp.]|nr:twin-arginine translocation pathway signal protein [Pararhodobacter sp.]